MILFLCTTHYLCLKESLSFFLSYCLKIFHSISPSLFACRFYTLSLSLCPWDFLTRETSYCHSFCLQFTGYLNPNFLFFYLSQAFAVAFALSTSFSTSLSFSVSNALFLFPSSLLQISMSSFFTPISISSNTLRPFYFPHSFLSFYLFSFLLHFKKNVHFFFIQNLSLFLYISLSYSFG